MLITAQRNGIGCRGGFVTTLFNRWRQRRVWAWVLLLSLPPLGFSGLAAAADLASAPASAEYLVRAWDTEDGLPENSATAIVQTEEGYLWFGTFKGLVRFDGVEFRVFDPSNTPMPSPGVVNLHLDKGGRLWVSTYRGLVVREEAVWRQLPRTDGGAMDMVRTFSERANGDVLVTAFNGPIYEFSGGTLRELPLPPGEKGKGYFGGAEEDGRWWVAQNKFIGRWDTDRWVAMISPPDLPEDALALGPSRDGGLWLLLGKELRKLRRGTEVARHVLTEEPGGVWSLAEDSQGNVWIASYNEGFIRVTASGASRRWAPADGVSDNGRCVFEDRERSLWLGTSGDGLLRLTRQRFQHFGLTSRRKGSQVHSVSADRNGGVWAATFGQGLLHLSDVGVVDRLPPGLTNNLPYLQSVLEDRMGRLWVSGMGEGIRLFDRAGADPVRSVQVGGLNVIALFEDSRGQIWMSSASGRVSRSDGKDFTVFDAEAGLPMDAGFGFAEDAGGAIWVVSESGLFCRLGERPFVQVKDATGAAIRNVNCLTTDGDGSVWLGSSDRGLLRLKQGTVAVLDADRGFPVTAVDDIIEDVRGFFWMTSGRRIVRAHLPELQAVADGRLARVTCQIFDASDGLAGAEFAQRRQPTSTRDRHGRLWFATTRGVATIDPATLQLNGQVPPVHVEEISFYRPAAPVTNTIAGRQHIRETPTELRAPFASQVVLPAGSRRIAIRFSALSLVAPEKTRFQVKLEGVDQAWEEAEARRTASYFELPPRKYVFRVRASNNDGVWNETGASLAFTVLPYFWQTGWFRLGTGLLLVALGGVLAWSWSRRHIAQALERERLAHEMQHLREELAHSSRVSTMGQLASSLAHELNQPLGAILRNTEAAELLVEQVPPDLAEIRAILADIRLDDQRAGGVIDRMRALLKRQKAERTYLALDELLHEVGALARTDALRRKVQMTVEVAPGLPPVCGDRIQLQQVLLNLILNGMDAMSEEPPENRRLIVEGRQMDAQTLEVRVRDRGPGVPAQSVSRLFEPFFSTKPHGMGLGLSISRTIIEAHQGKISVENQAEGGACFAFTLPVASAKWQVAGGR